MQPAKNSPTFPAHKNNSLPLFQPYHKNAAENNLKQGVVIFNIVPLMAA